MNLISSHVCCHKTLRHPHFMAVSSKQRRCDEQKQLAHFGCSKSTRLLFPMTKTDASTKRMARAVSQGEEALIALRTSSKQRSIKLGVSFTISFPACLASMRSAFTTMQGDGAQLTSCHPSHLNAPIYAAERRQQFCSKTYTDAIILPGSDSCFSRSGARIT